MIRNISSMKQVQSQLLYLQFPHTFLQIAEVFVVAIHDLTFAFRNPKSIKRLVATLTFLLHLREHEKHQLATDFVNVMPLPLLSSFTVCGKGKIFFINTNYL